MQEEHREASVREGVIRDFVEKEVPDDWNTWDASRRQTFWSGGDKGAHNMVPRDRVCALEVWVEAFGGNKLKFTALVWKGNRDRNVWRRHVLEMESVTEKMIEQKLARMVKTYGGLSYKFVSPGNIDSFVFVLR